MKIKYYLLDLLCFAGLLSLGRFGYMLMMLREYNSGLIVLASLVVGFFLSLSILKKLNWA